MSRPNLLFTFSKGWSSPVSQKVSLITGPHSPHNSSTIFTMHTTSCLIVIQSIAFAILNVGEGQAEDCPHERARCGRCQISETSYNQFRRVFFNILSGSGGWVANPTQRPKCMTSSTTVAVRPLIFPFLLFLLFLCKKGTGAFLQRTWKMLRMMRLPFLLFWVAPHWYLRYLTQRSASSLIGSIRINIGIRHLVELHAILIRRQPWADIELPHPAKHCGVVTTCR